MIVGENGLLTPCAHEYDKRAIGVVAGAAALRPAITFGAGRAEGTGVAIALVGTVYCLADADLDVIEVGDMLTTSETRGHAKKAADATRGVGSTIGKALAPLTRGRGLVPILVAMR
jgi:hypothetical protein